MANINIRIDDSLKKEAETIFANIGLNSTTAINLFFRQVVRTNSIPFDLIADIPNQKTIDAINQKFGKAIVTPASLKIIGAKKKEDIINTNS